MKGSFWLAAAAAACLTNAAWAATIIQVDSEQGALRGFDGFDPTQGTLNKVTLTVDLTKTRAWVVSAPSGGITSASIDWAIDGKWLFRSDNDALGRPLVSLTGTGRSDVMLDRAFDDVSFGYFEVTATGSARYDFDPAEFVGRRTTFDGFDLGYLIDSGDTRFSGVPLGGEINQLSEGCGVLGSEPLRLPESLCGAANYTLTYDYTPAVPEPATWAMMLTGFVVTGAALRRRRRTASALG